MSKKLKKLETVALVHYHLKPGGVTRVLEAQCKALEERGIRYVVIAGTPWPEKQRFCSVAVPKLNYETNANKISSEELVTTVREAAFQAFGGEPDLWHVHNHSLGKNVAFAGFIEKLANSQTPLLLQIHDFAEDGRPANYSLFRESDRLYPIAPHIRYALINSRDYDLLEKARLPKEQLVRLPNAISGYNQEVFAPSEDASPLVFYPVRGIRRKNLGEFCLLAALAPPEARFAVSLRPQNEIWKSVYERWEYIAKELELPIDFAVANRLAPPGYEEKSFESWLNAATHLATTSVAEGFGLAFLEPTICGKPLLGRDLPEITKDFTREGLKLGHLYKEVLVPKSWVDEERLCHILESSLKAFYAGYGKEITEQDRELAWKALHPAGEEWLSFGNLPELLQEALINKSLSAPEAPHLLMHAGEICSLASWLEEVLQVRKPTLSPSELSSWSLTAYQEKLVQIYNQILNSPSSPPAWLPKEKVLEQFLKPNRFHFLRT